MYYYVLGGGDGLTVLNSIVVREGDDPARYGAVADARVWGIGETWVPPEPEEPEPGLEARLAALEGAVRRGLGL